MATKLKNMELTSVDLVEAGANQKADICLFKSAAPAEPKESHTEEEMNIFKRFITWLRNDPTEGAGEPYTPVEKEYSTFDSINQDRESGEKLCRYTDALAASIRSIREDNELSAEEKLQMMNESLEQFDSAMAKLFVALCGAKTGDGGMAKSYTDPEEDLSYLTEGIDKSDRFDVIDEL